MSTNGRGSRGNALAGRASAAVPLKLMLLGFCVFKAIPKPIWNDVDFFVVVYFGQLFPFSELS